MGGAPCTALPGGLGLSSFLPGRLLNWIGLITSREERDLNTEELAKLERVKAALSENEAGLIEAEAKLESERRMPSIPDENAAFAPMAGVDNRNAGFIADKSKSGRPGKKYADLFGPHFDTGGFASLNEFQKSVHVSGSVFDRIPKLPAAACEPCRRSLEKMDRVDEATCWAMAIRRLYLEDILHQRPARLHRYEQGKPA